MNKKGISLKLRTNLFIGRKNMSEKIINLLLKHNDIFIPCKFDIEAEKSRPNKILFKENIAKAIAEMSDGEYPGLIAERNRPIKVSYVINSSRSQMFDNISLIVENKWFKSSINLSKFLGFAKDMYILIEASSGCIQNNSTESRYDRVQGYRGTTYFSEPRFPGVSNNLPGLFWANFFGPEYIEMWGYDFLLKSPSNKIEKLKDGGLIIYLSETPLKAEGSSYENNKEELYKYLGYDAFNGQRYPIFRTKGRWRKKRTARPLIETGGILDDVFADD